LVPARDDRRRGHRSVRFVPPAGTAEAAIIDAAVHIEAIDIPEAVHVDETSDIDEAIVVREATGVRPHATGPCAETCGRSHAAGHDLEHPVRAEGARRAGE
jgi:hypothetical protein